MSNQEFFKGAQGAPTSSTSGLKCSSDRSEIFQRLAMKRENSKNTASYQLYKDLMNPSASTFSGGKSRFTKRANESESKGKRILTGGKNRSKGLFMNTLIDKGNHTEHSASSRIVGKSTRKSMSSTHTRKRRKKKKKRGTTKRKVKRSTSDNTTNNSSLTREIPLSISLQNIVGSTAMSRPSVVKAIWAYAKSNKRVDPQDGRVIICDEKLKKIFDQKEKVHMFEIQTLLLPHFLYPKSNVSKESPLDLIEHSNNSSHSSSSSYNQSPTDHLHEIPNRQFNEATHRDCKTTKIKRKITKLENIPHLPEHHHSSNYLDPIISTTTSTSPLENLFAETNDSQNKTHSIGLLKTSDSHKFDHENINNRFTSDVGLPSILDIFIQNPSYKFVNSYETIRSSELTGDLRNISYIPYIYVNDSLVKSSDGPLKLFFSHVSIESVRVNFTLDITASVLQALNDKTAQFTITANKKITPDHNDPPIKLQDISSNINDKEATIHVENTHFSSLSKLSGYADFSYMNATSCYFFILRFNLLISGIFFKSLDLGVIDLMPRQDIYNWSVEAVCILMHSLNIPNFIQTCREYAIDGRALLKMTNSDFKALGLTVGFLIERIQSALVHFN